MVNVLSGDVCRGNVEVAVEYKAADAVNEGIDLLDSHAGLAREELIGYRELLESTAVVIERLTLVIKVHTVGIVGEVVKLPRVVNVVAVNNGKLVISGNVLNAGNVVGVGTDNKLKGLANSLLGEVVGVVSRINCNVGSKICGKLSVRAVLEKVNLNDAGEVLAVNGNGLTVISIEHSES